MNYLHLGPMRLRTSRKGLATWGYERLGIGGLSLLSRDSAGRLGLASYHPRRSKTWLWAVTLERNPDALGHRAKNRHGQWHDYHKLPFGWLLCVSQQDYHKTS